MIGTDYLDLVLSFVGSENGTGDLDLALHLKEVDTALDSLFSRFSSAVKYIIIFQICTALKLEPPRLRKSLDWMVQELRSLCW